MGDLKAEPYFAKGHPLNNDNRPVIAFIGARHIPSGQHLRGLTLLNHFGKRFTTEAFPSITLGNFTSKELSNSIRAGYQAYAAAVSDFPIPGEPTKQQQRAQQARHHIRLAQSLLPGLHLTLNELHY